MEFIDIIEKELLYAKAKVEVLEDLKSKYAPVEQEQATEFVDFADETQATTETTF